MIRFELDGVAVEAATGETIWEVARRAGTTIPHLCHRPQPGYRPDGNCRACMVEIDGERVLAASCRRTPGEGMKVRTASARAERSRRLVMELLLADQPARERAHDPQSHLWRTADAMGLAASRFPAHDAPAPDLSHPAMAVALDACIQCGLCARGCREVQGNDVIGMAYRNADTKVVFDFDDPMGASTCVACGECVQACPTGALMPSAYLDETLARTVYPEREVESLCPYCGVGCRVSYKVAGDRIVYAEGANGPANENRLCVKGRFGFDYIAHPHRLTTPLVRRDDAPAKSADAVVDPANPWTHFREASWEEALTRAAEGLVRIKAAHGPGALAGFGSAKGSNEEAYLFQKLVRTGFGSNNVDHCTRLCHASSVAALMEGLSSGAVSAPFAAALDAQVIVVIGANPAVNHPVAATYIKNAVRKGAKLIVIDPRRQALSRYAHAHLAFRPGTDVALLNALINTIVTEGLVDDDYVADHVDCYETLRARVAPFTPEAMAPICGIDAQVLRETARLYARSQASLIFWGMGISQHVHGTDNARCLIALALLTGQIGRPGTGLHPLRGQNNVQGASDAGLIPMVLPDYRPVGGDARAAFEAAWGATLDEKPGLTVVEIMDAILAGRIRGMYIMGENPAMSDPDLHHARAALAALDHLVVQDLFLTETAFHADVVLPASAFAEKTGTFTNTDRRVQLARAVVPPPGEARQDLWIIQAIARRMGLPWDHEHPREVFAEMASLMPSLANISWERLEREGAVTYPVPEPEAPGRAILFGERFPTPSGRAKLVPADIVPPDETPDADYPLVLTTGRVLEHWHTGSMTRRTAVLDAIEPAPAIHLSPADCARLGLSAGDIARLETRRGAIEALVRADADVPAGLVFLPFCYAEAAANLLTNPALDPFGKIPEFKFCAARVRAPARAEAADA